MIKSVLHERLQPVRDTLSNRGVSLLLLSGVFRSGAQWMDIIVLGWFVLDVSGSSFEVAKVAFFRMIPLSVSGPLGGVLADRFPRKRILLFTGMISMGGTAVLAVLISFDIVVLWHIYVVALVLGIGFSANNPARRAVMRDLAGDKLLINALALDQIGFSLSRVLGPFIGGLTISILGAGSAFVLVTFLHICSFLALLFMWGPPVIKRLVPTSILTDLKEGFVYVFAQPVMRAVMAITIAWNLLVWPFMQLLPVFAKDVLNVDATGLGLMGSMSGVGALLGTIIMASLPSTKRPGLLFVVGAFAFGVGVLLVSLSQWFPVSLAMLFGLGVGQSAYFVLQTSLILLVSNDQMRGRAMGILTLGIGAGPIGTLVVGYLAEIYGAPLAVSSAAAIGLVILVVIIFSMPQLIRDSVKPDNISTT